MKNYKFKILKYLLINIFLLCAPQSQAATTEKPIVVINEIAWMGSENSANDEWLELFNTTDQEINLENWTLKSKDGSPEIKLSGTVAPQGYFLLERTNDETVKTIPANQIYTGSLNNSGEKLELKDSQNNLIDYINCQENWFAGDNSLKKTMERKIRQNNDKNSWQTSSQKGGTPKTENSKQDPETKENNNQENAQKDLKNKSLKSTTTPATSANQSPVAITSNEITGLAGQEIVFNGSESYDPEGEELEFTWNFGDGKIATGKKVKYTYSYPGEYLASLQVSDGTLSDTVIIKIKLYSNSIVINEFIPNPEGLDKKNEWIEIYNQGNEVINLSDWKINDNTKIDNSFVFPENSFIGPKQFLVIQRQTSKISLNNKKDQVRLFYPNGALASQIDYSKKEEGYSVAKKANQYFWTDQPTPGSKNIISIKTSEKNSNSKKSTSTAFYSKALNFLKNKNQDQLTFKETNVKTKEINKKPIFFKPLIAEAKTPSSLDLKAKQQKKQEENKKETNSKIKPTSNQSASLNSISAKNSKLILALSIIISAGMLFSWLVIVIKKVIKNYY